MSFPTRSGRIALLLPVVFAACTDATPTHVQPRTEPLQQVTCTADVRAGTVRCGEAAALVPGARPVIVGGQGTLVMLRSSNVAYDAGTEVFSVDVTVQNLLAQRMGTPDGTAVTGIRVFFPSEPVTTEGAGTVTVLADSAGTFTNADQPYFLYPQSLADKETSAPRTWRMSVPPSVDQFSFRVYVAADLPQESTLLRWLPNELTPEVSSQRWQAIWGSGPGDVYVVGTAIARYDGSAWTVLGDAPAVPTLYGVWGSGADDVFAVGLDGTIVHYDGTAWIEMESGVETPLYAVWGTGPGDVYAGGSGGLLHYDGTAWTAVELDFYVQGLWGTGPSDVYAINEVDILHFDGSAWTRFDPDEDGFDGIYDVWGTGPSDVYVSQSYGLYHFDGASWTFVDTGPETRLYDLWGTGNDDLFAVGQDGIVLHYDGTRWTDMSEGVSGEPRFTDVWGGPDDVFVLNYPLDNAEPTIILHGRR